MAQPPADAIADDSINRDGGEDNTTGNLVEEEVDKVNCRLRNGYRFPTVAPLGSRDYSRAIAGGDRRGGEDGDDGSGLVVVVCRDACSRQIGGRW